MLPEQLKEDICNELSDYLQDVMFGDGLECDYIWDGMTFKGLNNMTDEELIEEYKNAFCWDEDDDEELDNPTWKAIQEYLKTKE